MTTTNWKQKSLAPVLLSEEDASFSTMLDIQEAIRKKDILNIAVTGPYGAAKSSVLQTSVTVSSVILAIIVCNHL